MDQEAGNASLKPKASDWPSPRVLRLTSGTLKTILSVQVFLVVVLAACVYTVYASQYSGKEREPLQQRAPPRKSFYDADGETGYDHDVVPDVIHIIRYNQTELIFMDVVFLRSMYLNHRPSTIMVHCSPCGITGPYVNWIEGINFTYKPYLFPREVFGRKINSLYHATDVARIHILMRYGGIYLDRDVFVVNPLRRFLRYEATVACAEGGSMASNILIFHKNARFLRLYHETYRLYNGSQWYFNAGQLPTRLIVLKRKHLMHRMYYGLEIELDMLGVLYEPHAFPNWRGAIAMHTFIFHRFESPWDPLHNGNMNETNIRDLDNAIGQMSRSVLFGTSDLVGPDAPVLSVAELAARKDRGEDLTKMKAGNAKPFYLK